MPQKSNNELGAGGLSEAGMKINYHDGKDELEEILKSVQHAGAADLTRQFLEFTNILRREDQEDILGKGQELPSGKENLFIHDTCPDHKTAPSLFNDYEATYPALQESNNVRALAREIPAVAGSIGEHDEQRWALFMHRFVFEKFHDMIRKEEKIMTKRPLGETELMYSFRIGSDHRWKYGGALLEENRKLRGNSKFPRLTAPQPDLYLAFHVHALPGHSSLNNSKGFNDSVVQNFGSEKLQDLAQMSKCCDPENKRFHPSHLKDYAKTLPKDRKCRIVFPWLIGEWKHAEPSRNERSKVIWQAANACAVALTLLAKLASQHPRIQIPQDVRPVFAITSVGPEASLWVAFVQDVRLNGALSFEMHRIWHGNLAKQLCAIELCLFLDRLHAWAIDKLRRWISECISELNYRLTTQSGVNSDRTESSVENSSIGLHGASVNVEQPKEEEEEEPIQHKTDRDRAKQSKPARRSMRTADLISKQNPKPAEGLESVSDRGSVTPFPENESSSEYVPSQKDERDSDGASDSVYDTDSVYESCEEHVKPLDESNLNHETDSEEATGSEDAGKSPLVETPRPTRHYDKEMSKQKSPDATPLARETSKRHGYFSTPTRDPKPRATSASDAQRPFLRVEKSYKTSVSTNNSPMPSRRSVSTQGTTILPSTSGTRDSKSPVPFCSFGNLYPQDKPQERIYLGREFVYRSKPLLSTPPGSPALTLSTSQKFEQQAHSLGSADRIPRAAKIPASKQTGRSDDTDTHTEFTPRENPIFDLPLINNGVFDMNSERKTQGRPPLVINFEFSGRR